MSKRCETEACKKWIVFGQSFCADHTIAAAEDIIVEQIDDAVAAAELLQTLELPSQAATDVEAPTEQVNEKELQPEIFCCFVWDDPTNSLPEEVGIRGDEEKLEIVELETGKPLIEFAWLNVFSYRASASKDATDMDVLVFTVVIGSIQNTFTLEMDDQSPIAMLFDARIIDAMPREQIPAKTLQKMELIMNDITAGSQSELNHVPAPEENPNGFYARSRLLSAISGEPPPATLLSHVDKPSDHADIDRAKLLTEISGSAGAKRCALEGCKKWGLPGKEMCAYHDTVDLDTVLIAEQSPNVAVDDAAAVGEARMQKSVAVGDAAAAGEARMVKSAVVGDAAAVGEARMAKSAVVGDAAAVGEVRMRKGIAACAAAEVGEKHLIHLERLRKKDEWAQSVHAHYDSVVVEERGLGGGKKEAKAKAKQDAKVKKRLEKEAKKKVKQELKEAKKKRKAPKSGASSSTDAAACSDVMATTRGSLEFQCEKTGQVSEYHEHHHSAIELIQRKLRAKLVTRTAMLVKWMLTHKDPHNHHLSADEEDIAKLEKLVEEVSKADRLSEEQVMAILDRLRCKLDKKIIITQLRKGKMDPATGLLDAAEFVEFYKQLGGTVRAVLKQIEDHFHQIKNNDDEVDVAALMNYWNQGLQAGDARHYPVQ
jgi:hypothetical protein